MEYMDGGDLTDVIRCHKDNFKEAIIAAILKEVDSLFSHFFFWIFSILTNSNIIDSRGSELLTLKSSSDYSSGYQK